MMSLLLLMGCYGLMFGFQNKLPFLYTPEYLKTGKPQTFLDRLLHCSYCLGFHCGWMVWLTGWGLLGSTWIPAESTPLPMMVAGALHLLGWCFTSAAFCYIVDAVVRRLER